MMAIDYQIPISISDFDKLTEKRIMQLIEIQGERLEEKRRRMEEERKAAERKAARNSIMKK